MKDFYLLIYIFSSSSDEEKDEKKQQRGKRSASKENEGARGDNDRRQGRGTPNRGGDQEAGEYDPLRLIKAWLPDGYSQICRSYVFGPSGFWAMAPLHCAAKFDPFLSLPSTLAQSKERKGSNFAIWQP